jgi:hypothetical protein
VHTTAKSASPIRRSSLTTSATTTEPSTLITDIQKPASTTSLGKKPTLPSKPAVLKNNSNNNNNNNKNKNNNNNKPELKPKTSNKFEVPKLRHVETRKTDQTPDQVKIGGPDWKAKPSTASDEPIEVEEGIKIISQDSIDNIRQGGQSFSFNFNKNDLETVSKKAYLPIVPPAESPLLPLPVKDLQVDHQVPIGVIKPISRVTAQEKKPPPPPPTPTMTTLNNLINENKTKEDSNIKEVANISDKTVIEPILKSVNTVNKKISVNKGVTFAPDPVLQADEGITEDSDMEFNPDQDQQGGGKENGYRDNWKKRQEAENKNTMVFNFVNSQKDVTHIENDGLDLSKRKKKQHLRIAKVRQFIHVMYIGSILGGPGRGIFP